MNELLIAVRAFHFVAAVLLFGTFAFLVSVARPVFRRASQPMREEQFKLHRRLVQNAAWSLAAFFLSDLLWLAVQAATMSGAQLDSVLNRETLGTSNTSSRRSREERYRLLQKIPLLGHPHQLPTQEGQLLITRSAMASKRLVLLLLLA